MARAKNFYFFFIFAIFFALGVWIIRVVFGNPYPSENTKAPGEGLGYLETFLVIGVDNLSQSQAILESAWIITINSASSQIDLVPLYPDKMPPHDPIMVPTSDYGEYKDLGIIQKYKGDWSGVIILDITGFNMVVEIAGERHSQISSHNGYDHLGLPRAWEEPVESLNKQKNVIIFLCENSHPFYTYESIQYLIGFIPDHFRSSLSETELWGYWQLLSNHNFNLTCHYSW